MFSSYFYDPLWPKEWLCLSCSRKWWCSSYQWGDKFQKILTHANNNSNILVLLSCGALLHIEESKNYLQVFAKKTSPYFKGLRKLFSKIIGFTQHFQPFFSSWFLMDLSIQHFIFNCPTLKAVLQDHQGLGAHTDIVEIMATTTTTYIWVHQSSHPFGQVYQCQCPLCSCLSTISPKFDKQGGV